MRPHVRLGYGIQAFPAQERLSLEALRLNNNSSSVPPRARVAFMRMHEAAGNTTDVLQPLAWASGLPELALAKTA